MITLFRNGFLMQGGFENKDVYDVDHIFQARMEISVEGITGEYGILFWMEDPETFDRIVRILEIKNLKTDQFLESEERTGFVENNYIDIWKTIRNSRTDIS